jgi:hypothetical protein
MNNNEKIGKTLLDEDTKRILVWVFIVIQIIIDILLFSHSSYQYIHRFSCIFGMSNEDVVLRYGKPQKIIHKGEPIDNIYPQIAPRIANEDYIFVYRIPLGRILVFFDKENRAKAIYECGDLPPD